MPPQLVHRQRLRGQAGIDQVRLQVFHAGAQPVAERRARGVDRVDVGIVQQAVLGQVHGQHLPGPQPALGDDARGRQVADAGFRGHQQHVVVGQRPARGPQAVAVQRAGRIAAVAHHQAGGAVPRLGVQRVVLVEGGQVLVDVLVGLPGRRHQDAHRRQQVQAAGQQHLQRVVQAFRIRAVLAHQRTQLGEVQVRAGQDRRARQHPAAVGADGVDLAVVRQHAERLRQAPLRRGVGGEALVEHHRARATAPGGSGRRTHRAGGRVRPWPCRRWRARTATAGSSRRRRRPVRRGDGRAAGRARSRPRPCPSGASTNTWRMRGMLATASGPQGSGSTATSRQPATDRPQRPVGFLQGSAHGLPASPRPRRTPGRRRTMAAGSMPSASRQRAQPVARAMDQHAAAVAADAVGVDRAAMRQARQRHEGVVDQLRAAASIHMDQQAESASIMLELGVVEGTYVRIGQALSRKMGRPRHPRPARQAAFMPAVADRKRVTTKAYCGACGQNDKWTYRWPL